MLREIPSGREQAIETLLDMEPQGNFFRASRVLEESVPQALLNRPNLVTKSALVDKACALSKFEVDDHEKYDNLFGIGSNHEGRVNANNRHSFSSGRTLTRSISETKKNRILRHHSKIMTAKQKSREGDTFNKSNSNVTVSPSIQLVSALKKIYEKPTRGASGELVGFKSMLQAVMDHPAFSVADIKDDNADVSSPSTKVTKILDSERNTICGGKNIYTLESLIAYLCKEVSSSSPTFSPTLEHGLLITVLSILMEFEIPENEPKDYYSNAKKIDNEEKPKDHHRRSHDATNDPTVAPPLQVGSIMSLMKIDTEDFDDINPLNSWSLDGDLLSYFGEAAAVYEERIEIQKTRLLKRLSAGKGNITDGKTKHSAGGRNEEKQKSTSTKKEDDEAVSSVPNTPTPALSSPQPVADTPATPDVVATEVCEEDESETLSAAVFERIISAASGDGSSIDNYVENNADDCNDLTQNQGEAEQDGNDIDVNGEGDGVEVNRVEVEGNEEDEGGDAENDVDADEDGDDGKLNDSSCSSSSSSSSSSVSHLRANPGDVKNNEENGNSDEADEEENDDDDDDDDDDLVLRQALALSLVEQVESYSTQIDSSSTHDEEDIESSPTSPSTETSMCPLTPTNKSPKTKESETDQDVEESPLPTMPFPPRIDPYASLRGPNVQIDENQIDNDSLTFDPSALNIFGSIPASNVLIQLLLHLNALSEFRLYRDNKSDPVKNLKNDRLKGENTATSGGVGSLLFTPKLRSFKTKVENENEKNDIGTSLQLSVSLFLLNVEMRNHAIDNLKRAVAQEKMGSVTDEAKLVGESCSSGEEGDDPAIALGLTHIDDENFESKESLEAKGMRRKAAAAARDAAALSESLRKRTEAWKKQVIFFSKSCFLSMKYLRLLLQSVTRNWLREQQGVSCADCHKMLPTTVISKLSFGLASFSSLGTINSLHSVLVGKGDSLDDAETIFMNTKLYKLSILLWGESVPIIYPSVTAQVELLRLLLNECTTKDDISKHHRLLDSVISLPLKDSEPPLHKLQFLIRRLRVSDLLDRYVSGPKSHSHFNDGKIESGSEKNELGEPNGARSVIDIVRSASNLAVGSLKDDLCGLYLALCHRYHISVLLWDGLGTCLETEIDDSTASLSTSPVDTIRVSQTHTSTIQFDARKCSDSMSILSSSDVSGLAPSSSSIHQRASKVWGTVLSSTPFSPKTGVHKWAIRLDKCERGHVFIGVATAQASMRTYVGGDKYGWGMIGTQALWHDRRKIRGDYGATFRTGSTIIVTLDTDAGTISYSSWKHNVQNDKSMESIVHSISSSPRQQGQGSEGGIVEDWGVAFEGLPLDSKLYPAVGLYQRDDKVTLLTVESTNVNGCSGNSSNSIEGLCYYPNPSLDQNQATICDKIRVFNEKVQLDGIHYILGSLKQIFEGIRDETDDLWKVQLPSLVSAICLYPRNIPILSKRFGLSIICKFSKLIPELEEHIKSGKLSCKPFQKGFQEGEWVIRATGSSGTNSDAEEYVVDLTSSTDNGEMIGFKGNGIGTIGKSKNGLVSILGTINGSSMHFVEEWMDTNTEGFSTNPSEDSSSSCIINARMSLDGTKFEGRYRNVQVGTTGNIAGLLRENNSMKVPKFRAQESNSTLNLQSSESCCGVVALLCLAHSHLASIIGEDLVTDVLRKSEKPISSALTHKEWELHSAELQNCLSLKTFAQSSLILSEDDTQKHVQDLREFYLNSTTFRSDELIRLSNPLFEGFNVVRSDNSKNPSLSIDVTIQVERIDEDMCRKCCGTGSLAPLCPSEYRRARLLLLSALIIHCRKNVSMIDASDPELKDIWIYALKLMEDGVRHSIASRAKVSAKKKATEYCKLSCDISELLLRLEPSNSRSESNNIHIVGEDFSHLYSRVSTEEDVGFLIEEFSRSSRKALLRMIPIREILTVLESPIQSSDVIESLVVGVPRLLGRGYVDITRPIPGRNESKEELGCHFLSNLPGVGKPLRNFLQQHVQQLLDVICRLAEHGVTEVRENPSPESLISEESMTLALISCLTIVLRTDDIEGFVLNSRLLALIQAILDSRRRYLLSFDAMPLFTGNNVSIIKALQKMSRVEVSKAILKATVSLAHVVFYQTWSVVDANDESGVEATSACLEILFKELANLNPLVLDVVKTSTLEIQNSKKKLQWELFCKECSSKAAHSKGKPATKSKLPNQAGWSCIKYVQENGLLTNTQQNTPQKPFGTRKSPSSVHGSEKLPKDPNFFRHQFFSHWLHILFAAKSIEVSRKAIVNSSGRITALFRAIGINVDLEDGGKILSCKLQSHLDIKLPARYRCRLLRLLHPILESMVPSKELAQSIFTLAGSSCTVITQSHDEDEGAVSRETISLLRRLHLPNQTLWRACINDVMKENISSVDSSGERNGRVGVLCFLNGSFDSIKKGSYVLLKPAAAVPLSADRQAASGSKSHTSSSILANSSPHHLVGNGTEGVVAGLSRFDASAGIVSSIDTKNGVCEVILLERSSHLTKTDSDEGACISDEISNSSRPALTVRALRSPMLDIVLSQEVSIFIDKSMLVENLVPRLLEDSVSILRMARCSPGANNKTVGLSNLWLQMTDVTIALMSMRSAITLLSDEKIASSFLKQEKARSVLSDALNVAYPDELSSSENLTKGAKDTCLSSFPIHEVRLLHILSLFRNLDCEERILEETSEATWDTRIRDIEKHIQAEASNCDFESKDSGCKTPPTETNNPPVANAVDGSTKISTNREESSSNRIASHSTASSENSEDDEENEAAATAAAHLREAAIAQMAELGLPRSWSELALRRTGGTNIEAAVHFCLERGGEMERLLAEDREREEHNSGGSGRRRSSRAEASSHLLRQLTEMGFPSRWCAEALTATGNNVDEALTWILTNGERLSAEDEGMDEDEEDADDDDDDDDDEEEDDDADEDEGDDADEDDDDDDDDVEGLSHATTDQQEEGEEQAKISDSKNDLSQIAGWTGSMVPLRFISGRSIIDQVTLTISGLPSGGFSSVGSKGVLLTSGKWYYEAILETAGCLQIGWADGSFAGHCHSDRGDGCGDGPSSWAYDGWRRYRWHSMATEWGCRWAVGDVIGCLVDMDQYKVSFTLNGKGEEIGMGVAFSGQGFRPCGGVYACVSFNRKEKLRLILGGPSSTKFKYPPPNGYRGVGEAVLERVKERDALLAKETVLGTSSGGPLDKRFLCDFSDGEHGHELMAWAHRYYGSDASVHLGSGRSKQSVITSKLSSLTSTENRIVHCLARRIGAEWLKNDYDLFSERNDDDEKKITVIEISNKMKEGICAAGVVIFKQAMTESMILSSLISRKLILNIIVATGDNFDPGVILDSDDTAQASVLRFWNMIEVSTSLRTAGWVGEASAMAVAAEALGLGISSTESLHSRLSTMERCGFVSIGDLDEGIFLPAGGLVQMLNTVMDWNGKGSKFASTGCTLTASAEAAVCSGGGGGILLFLLKGLQSAVCKSEEFRCVVIACIRRAVRQLAVVEYENDDSVSSETDQADEDSIDKSTATKEKKVKTTKERVSYPDARLVTFLTGLLLSTPAAENVNNLDEIQTELFEAWSIGLLSASLPWRMICVLTTAGILNQNPRALSIVVKNSPTLSRYYARLRSTVCRRVWAERAAAPVCSRYCQAMIELLCSVTRAVKSGIDMPSCFVSTWEKTTVDAATPLPMPVRKDQLNWEVEDGWVSSDHGWETWTGTMERFSVDWATPSRSAVRTLMESGDGPSMLREGCIVIRGLDWDESKHGNDDGKDKYEIEKEKREKEKNDYKSLMEAEEENQVEEKIEKETMEETTNPVEESGEETKSKLENESENTHPKKKKFPSPKLPIGSVISIEPWNGVPGMARRVRWNLTGIESVYRYGGDGGSYDINHVEVNDKRTRVRKRHPLPESEEQCAARHGFGVGKIQSILLRLRHSGESKRLDDGEVVTHRDGVLELPEFGAGVYVQCIFKLDGTFVLHEKYLLYGSNDSGWHARFGQPSYVPSTTVTLKPSTVFKEGLSQADIDCESPNKSLFQEFVGTSTYRVENLRNRSGGEVYVKSELRFKRCRRSRLHLPKSLVESNMPPTMHFDCDFHASSLSLSCDGRTLSCVSSDGRGTAFGNIGFSKGVHYWEIKLEQADIGSVFVGVAEKPNESGSGSSHSYDTLPRLNRWHGWGFVNFRATYTYGAERIYGAHCHAGDTIGVLLDCDAGRISFFFDGLKYGEHILNDLGCAFENLSPFGFNVDGCGSGGAGQGAPSGSEGNRGGRYFAQGNVRPRTLWPVVGLRNHGDRVTFSSKWNSSYGVSPDSAVRNILATDEIIHTIPKTKEVLINDKMKANLPQWFIDEGFAEYTRWNTDSLCRAPTRGSGPFLLASFGLDVDLDSSLLACATASALIGLNHALLSGDRVRLKRSAGRILELAEEAIVLGSYSGKLYYQIASMKSEGGSLNEGGGRAWFWDESEVVDGIEPINKRKGYDIVLPFMDRFKCTSSGGLKVVYEGGAVIRSDLEIFEGSLNIGSIPIGTIIPKADVIERRVNACGVVRYRVRFEDLEGWISSKIRGGREEAIVIPYYLQEKEDEVREEETKLDDEKSYPTPGDCASEWIKKYTSSVTAIEDDLSNNGNYAIASVGSFESLIAEGVIDGFSPLGSDAFLSRTVSIICDNSEGGNPLDTPFDQVASAISYAIASWEGKAIAGNTSTSTLQANQAAAAAFESLSVRKLPSCTAIMARIALLRAFNRRARFALPWMSVRPCQEGSAILGGVYGHGASIDRAGRSSNKELLSQWVQLPSIANTIRNIRGLLFTSVKQDFLRSVTEATTTPTPLSHDEYELPREIRTVRINRLRARHVMAENDIGAQRKYSVFAQLHDETKLWGGAAFRRGFVAKGHGGQKRAFKMKLIGEGVNDYSGPYREAFTDAVNEVVQVDSNGNGTLGVLDPTPNNASDIGENRNLLMFSLNGTDLSKIININESITSTERSIRSTFSSLITVGDESSREVEEALIFLGRLAGTAYRHGIQIDLPLAMNVVWKVMVEEQSKDEGLKELDFLAHQQHVDDEKKPPSALLMWQHKMLNSFIDGIASVLPVEIFSILTGEELRDFFCGNPEIDVDVLKHVVEYEGYDESDEVIKNFWEILRELTNEERKRFLQFVWARNRLPRKLNDFDAPFKIQKDNGNVESLPSASTCFFSLTLPEYETKVQLKEKLLFAINNASTMETDFNTNNAEIAEGYRTI